MPNVVGDVWVCQNDTMSFWQLDVEAQGGSYSIVNERSSRAIFDCTRNEKRPTNRRGAFVSIKHSTSVLQKVNIFVGKLVPIQPRSNFEGRHCLGALALS